MQGIRRPVVAIRCGDVVARYDSIADAARAMGVRPPNVRNVAAGLQKTCRGFQWRFADEMEEDEHAVLHG